MIERWLKSSVVESLGCRRIVHITGARQSGKTTLATSTPLKNVRRYTMDDDSLRETAADGPIEFAKRKNGETIVIDEVQKVPELLNAIMIHVDRSTDRGQYLLTGSSSLDFMRKSADSLAGRMHTIRLRTLTLGEVTGNAPSFFERAFQRDLDTNFTPLGKRDIMHLAFQGGYPETIGFSPKARREWCRDYLHTLVARDIKNATGIRKLDVLEDIALWLFSRSSKLWTTDDLCRALRTTKETAGNYVAALEAMYLFDKVPAWNKTDYDRIGKAPKYFASDTALIANCLDWNEEASFLNSDLSGKLVESWVYHEIAAIADANDCDCKITHYRDKDKREIDFIVTNSRGEMIGLEVKSGDRIGKDDFKHLKWFAKNLAKDRPFTGIVLYSGEHTLAFGEGFYAVPLAALGA